MNPLGQITSPQTCVDLLFCGSLVCTAYLGVALGSQNVCVARIVSVDHHVGGGLHNGTAVTEIRTGDLAQPAEVNQVEWRV